MKMRLLAALAIGCAPLAIAAPAAAQLSLGISVNFGPPVLPVYLQPPIPGPDFIWTPGYWAWDNVFGDYYWIPGSWVRAPRPGLLWTPAWWGWEGGAYLFHSGYWGPHVGFYGGISYGFGYTGSGYQGGYWNGGHVFYNRTVNNISNVSNINVTNVYNRTVVNNNITRVSYNGGAGGVVARPAPSEQAFAREQHFAPTGMQQQQIKTAHNDPQSFVHANGGRPPHPAMMAVAAPMAGGHPGAPRGAPPIGGNGMPQQRQAFAAPNNARPMPGEGNQPRQAFASPNNPRPAPGGWNQPRQAFAAPNNPRPAPGGWRPPQGQPQQPHWAPRPEPAFAGQHMAAPMRAAPPPPRPHPQPQPHQAPPHPHSEGHHDHG